MNKLYGAILGDLAGMPYEQSKDIPKMSKIKIRPEKAVITDDTLMTLASASKILNNSHYDLEYRWWGNKYFVPYYGKSFKIWIKDITANNNSYGNGALMRLSPICHYYNHTHERLIESLRSINGSHNHEISAKSVIILALVYDWINQGLTKNQIELNLYKERYELPNKIKKFDKCDATCQGTLPFVLKVFLETKSTHESILTAINCGGDTDTNASIVGELSSTYYNDISQEDIDYVDDKLDDFQKDTLYKFNKLLNTKIRCRWF